MKNNKKNIKLISLLLLLVVGVVCFRVADLTTLIKSAVAVQALQSNAEASTSTTGRISSIAFSPNGKEYAFIGENGQIQLKDSMSGQNLWSGADDPQTPSIGVDFSPDGKTLVDIGSAAINFWDVATGQKKSTVILDNNVAPLARIAVNAGGTRLAAATQNHELLAWNLQASHPGYIVLGKGERVDELAFSPDGKTLAATRNGASGKLELWDSATGKAVHSFDFNSRIADVTFSFDGHLLAGATLDGRITFWQPQSGKVVRTINTQANLTSIAFSRDNKGFASGSGGSNPQVQYWSLVTGQSLFVRQAEQDAAVAKVMFNADGNQLASVGDNHRVSIWSLPVGDLLQVLVGHADNVFQASFIDGQSSFITAGNDGQIIVWDLATGSQQFAAQIPSFSTLAASISTLGAATQNISSNVVQPNAILKSTSVVAANIASPRVDTAVDKVLVKKKRSTKNLKGITALAVSKDGTELGAVAQDGSIQILLKNGTQRFKLSGHHGNGTVGLGFRDKAKQWVSAGRDTEIKIWDDVNGRQLKTLYGPEHPPRALAVSPDGKLIAVAGEETRIFIFDAEGRKLNKILAGHRDFVNGIAFNATSKMLASAGAEGRIILWDLATGKPLLTLLGHADEVNTVAFSPDGSLLASGSRDSTVKLWNTTTGVQIKSLSGHQGSVRSVTFSADGKKLASAGEDNKILVWNPATRLLTRQITSITSKVNAMVFSADGNLNIGAENSKISELNADTGAQMSAPILIQSPAVATPAPQSSLGNVGLDTDPVRLQLATNDNYFKLGALFNRLLEWVIPSANAALPDPNTGPGGPILVITKTTDLFGKYFAEILRTEGLNSFAVADIGAVSASSLTSYDVVILAQMTLTPAQVTMLTNWVTAGGNLISMKPDSQLNGLLGISPTGAPLISNGYLLIDTSASPGNGLVNQTIQFHGPANRYATTTASILATLYTNATTATTNPAVTLNNVGSSGGQAAAFAFDLASSIVYTRQGNPAWAALERDRQKPIRSDDKFFGNDPGDSTVTPAIPADPQPDWVDLNKISIPQADEQQRFLANLILEMNRDRKPLPRFWYFPKGKKAVVVMTGDDHASNGTQGRFEQFIAASTPGCSVADWECIRGTSYIFPDTKNATNDPYLGLTDAEALAYNNAGFEIGLHVNTACADFTLDSLRGFYTQQIQNFHGNYPSLPVPITQRHHCIAWSDWVTGAVVQLENGIRFDTSYYFWPPSWVQDRPGFFTGSGMPMRFANLNGSMIDVYNASSHMTDESGQSYPFTIDTLLDKAIGPEGFYGAFTINAHTDTNTELPSDSVIASAPARGIPIVSSKQMMDWLDGRNSSSFNNLVWNGNTLTFAITVGVGARNIRGLLPENSNAGVLLSISYVPAGGGAASSVSFTSEAIKGVAYGMFNAQPGTYTAKYGADTTPPIVGSKLPTAGAVGISQGTNVSAVFSEPMDAASINNATVELRGPGNTLVTASVSYNSSNRTVTLDPASALAGSTVYSATIKGGAADPRVKDTAGNAMATSITWTFTTEAQPCLSNPCSAWNNSTIPAIASVNDPSAVELGVKFTSDLDGFVTGIRFYKGAANTGTHIGNLWSAAGASLATATFTNETASGWQQVTFTNPVAITANTTYVASYFAPNGNYAATSSPEFSTQGVDVPPIHLLKSGVDGGNGVYAYGSSSSFPQNSFNTTNYWVDVLFSTTSGPITDTIAPTVTLKSPSAGDTGVSQTGLVTATFSEAVNATTINNTTFILRDGSNTPVPATVSYNAANKTATLTPNANLVLSTSYTATLKGGSTDPRVKDLAGNPLAADVTWTFTTAAVIQQGCSGNTSSIWASTATPTVVSDNDTSAVELGVKFRPSVNGYICGVRYYKGLNNTGTHVGKLWSSSGTLLASATFTGETATAGWKQVNFGSPVAVTANQVYVASYFAPVGNYAADENGLLSSVTNSQGNLTALASGTSGGNGVYVYGSGGFPNNTFNATNYWVDVAFTVNLGPDTTAPVVSSTTPPTNASNVSPTSTVSVVFSEPMLTSSITNTTIALRDAQNNLVAATVSYNAGTNTAVLTPSTPLADLKTYSAKVISGANGVKDAAQNPLAADYVWTFATGVNPCSPGGNPIVCENSKPGNPATQWDISGAGDASIQGFATDISVNVGQKVGFKIDTASTNYRLDIYRMGYYHNDGARKVATVQPTAFPNQPACLNDAATGLLDCGNWLESASWTVPSDAVSGIYFAKLVRQEPGNTGASHIFFVVRNDASHSDILFQTSDTTWQAYNSYGGNSFYGGSGPGTGGGSTGRAYKLSYNRPFNTRSVDNGQDWVFNAEYPMVRWLEANGYNVSYFTGVDSDRFGSLIRNHKLFMSTGHDEYWSGAQRANVEAARDASLNPVHLAFFSGNEVFWKTRWENSTDGSATPNRTLVCYKETHNYPNNPDPTANWTGTWRDPRGTPPAVDGGRPENSLTGSLFMVNDGATTSINVPQADGQMRFWRNTFIAGLASGASATLPAGTLGYEWDVDSDNGFRPAGLVRLSSTIVPNAPVLTDNGSTFGSGTANHAMSLYRASSGALVFGSGTVQWSWGLDANHDRGNGAPATAMQQATLNLFADMGIQPATMQPGLLPAAASTDVTPPVSTIVSPTAASSVAQGTLLVISGTASDVNGKVGGVEVSVNNGLTWHPANGRTAWTYSWNTPSTNGQVVIKSRAVDDSLNKEVPGAGITVTVGSGGDTTAPSVPANLLVTQVSATSANLAWTASTDVGGIASYPVERCLGATCTNFVEIARPVSPSFTNTGLTQGSTYRYRVRALDTSNNLSTYSAIVSIRPDGTPPNAPTGLTAVATGLNSVNLTWTAPSDNVGVTGYQVQRCAGNGCTNFVQVGAPTTANFANSGLVVGTTYQYRVLARDAAANLSSFSNVAVITLNNVPVAVADLLLFRSGVARTINNAGSLGLGVLANDIDSTNSALNAVQVGTLPAGVTLLANGTVTATITANSSFNYRANNGSVSSLPTTGASAALRLNSPPNAAVDSCAYNRANGGSITAGTACAMSGTRTFTVNLIANDTDPNAATTNIPTDGVGDAVVNAMISGAGTGVWVNANPACGQLTMGSANAFVATITNNCNGTIKVTVPLNAGTTAISFAYASVDDLGTLSTNRSNSITVQ